MRKMIQSLFFLYANLADLNLRASFDLMEFKVIMGLMVRNTSSLSLRYRVWVHKHFPMFLGTGNIVRP